MYMQMRCNNYMNLFILCFTGFFEMLHLLDIALNIIHTGIILFCLTGWIWRRTVFAHFILIAFIFASWFILGIWKGWGYCMLTDIQWHIKTKLGEKDLPNSFIKYLVDRISGRNISAALIDKVALVCFLLATLFAVINFIKYIKRKRAVPA